MDEQEAKEAIVQAESTIHNIDESWGQAFDVNIAAHWSVLLAIMAAMLGLVMASLRWKDRR